MGIHEPCVFSKWQNWSNILWDMNASFFSKNYLFEFESSIMECRITFYNSEINDVRDSSQCSLSPSMLLLLFVK